MKIITKCVIDIASGQTIEEESYEYDGPLALADFGGGGSADTSGMAAAIAQATELQNKMYQQTRTDLGPYREVGEATTPYYAGIMGLPGYDQVDPTQALRATPGWNFMFNQGINTLDRGAASKGMLGSGAAGKGLMTFGQGMADQSYNNYINRLYNLIGVGQNSAAQTGQAGQNMANSVSNMLMQGGQAQDQASMYNAQNRGSWANDLLGGVGLLGGLALSPMPQGGWKNTVGGSFFS